MRKSRTTPHVGQAPAFQNFLSKSLTCVSGILGCCFPISGVCQRNLLRAGLVPSFCRGARRGRIPCSFCVVRQVRINQLLFGHCGGRHQCRGSQNEIRLPCLDRQRVTGVERFQRQLNTRFAHQSCIESSVFHSCLFSNCSDSWRRQAQGLQRTV